MANTKSAQKAIRNSNTKNRRNRKIKDNYKAVRKQVLEHVEKKDKKQAEDLLGTLYKAFDKAHKAGVLHQNTAARYKSRVSKAVNSIAKTK